MDYAEYLWTHTPRCIGEFETQRAEMPGKHFDGHGAATACGLGEVRPFECEQYGVQPFEVFARFESKSGRIALEQQS